MIEVAEEFIEPVNGWQMLVAVAEVVLAELAGGVAEILEEFPDRWILGAEPERRARHADLGEAGTDRRLSGNKGGATGCAALLPIEISEHRAFLGDAVDVRRPVTHDAVVVATDIEPADVVGHDEENIRFCCLSHFNCSLVISSVETSLAGFDPLAQITTTLNALLFC